MTRFLRVACLPIAWLSALGAGAQEWIATEVRGGLLTFPAVVEGVETTAALNTGAALDSIDAAFAQRIGLTLSGRRQRVTSAYSASRSVASESQLEVELFGGKTVLHDTPALHHPDTPLLLGAGFLERSVLQIDYPNSRMRILPRTSRDLRKRDNVPMRAAAGSCQRRMNNLSPDMASGANDFAREALPQRGDAGDDTPCLPTVQVEFQGGKKVWLLLETGGAGPIVVSRTIAEREGWLDAHRSGSAVGSDVFGTRVAVDLLVLPSAKIGPFELRDVPVAVPAEGERLFSGRESAGRVETGTNISRGARANGRIGYDVLRHFVVSIDLKRELMQIERPEKASAESQGDSANP